MGLIGYVVLAGALLVVLGIVVGVGIFFGLRLRSRESDDLTELVPVASPDDVDDVALPADVRRPTHGDSLPSIGDRT